MFAMYDEFGLTDDGVAILFFGTIGVFMLAMCGLATYDSSIKGTSFEACLPECVEDGRQYKPKPHKGMCWCDVTLAIPLTDS